MECFLVKAAPSLLSLDTQISESTLNAGAAAVDEPPPLGVRRTVETRLLPLSGKSGMEAVWELLSLFPDGSTPTTTGSLSKY